MTPQKAFEGMLEGEEKLFACKNIITSYYELKLYIKSIGGTQWKFKEDA